MTRTVSIPCEPLVIDIDRVCLGLSVPEPTATATREACEAIRCLAARVVELEAAASTARTVALSPTQQRAVMDALAETSGAGTFSVEVTPAAPPAEPPSPRPGVVEIGAGYSIVEHPDENAVEFCYRGRAMFHACGTEDCEGVRALFAAAALGFSMQPRRFDPERDTDEAYLVQAVGGGWTRLARSLIGEGVVVMPMPPAPEGEA